MTTKIYHNPRCSKSRQTLELLSGKGIRAEVIEYLQTPPDHDTLDQLLTALGLQPRELMRTHEAPYSDNNLDDASLSREQLIAAMIANPVLIERPIVVRNGKAAIGRPPIRVLDLFEE